MLLNRLLKIVCKVKKLTIFVHKLNENDYPSNMLVEQLVIQLFFYIVRCCCCCYCQCSDDSTELFIVYNSKSSQLDCINHGRTFSHLFGKQTNKYSKYIIQIYTPSARYSHSVIVWYPLQHYSRVNNHFQFCFVFNIRLQKYLTENWNPELESVLVLRIE